MKKESGNKIRLGIFVSTGVALLLFGIYFIGQRQQLFNDTFRISGIFYNVSGLQVGNNVRFAGINVGTIEKIGILNDTSVVVDMIVDAEVQQFIRKDAIAVIGSDGLMGNKIMNITPGTSNEKIIENNDIIAAIQPVSMDEVFGQLKLTTDNAAKITSDLSVIIGTLRSGKGTIGKLFMDTSFAKKLDRTLVNIEQGTKGFKENMDAVKSSFLLRGYFKDQKKNVEKEHDSESGKKKTE